MKVALIVITILLIVVDWVAFLLMCRILNKHSIGHSGDIPVKQMLPYIIILVVASALIPIINIFGA